MVAVADGEHCQEDPDSMGQSLMQRKNVLFEADRKPSVEALPSPISSKSFILRAVKFLIYEHSGIYYINAYGSEIHPYPNPDFLTNLSSRQVLVYSCGSLWTRSVTAERPQSSADSKVFQRDALPCLTGSRQRHRKVSLPEGKSLVA